MSLHDLIQIGDVGQRPLRLRGALAMAIAARFVAEQHEFSRILACQADKPLGLAPVEPTGLGTGRCACGRTISKNKRACLAHL